MLSSALHFPLPPPPPLPFPRGMASKKKRTTFKEWLSSFVSKGEIPHRADNRQHSAARGEFFGHSQGFVVNNSPMIQGNVHTTYVQGDRNIVPQFMNLLSQHIIPGAAHDSSARSPPPRCHPDTRVKLIARITAWFNGQGVMELLLWITGPAGVGKSAIVQTFAEYLVKSKSLGASVFISRPNKRNNPNGIFITIAYQLATRIEAYRNFIVERLSLDPELLRGDVEAQFTTFIVEPFVEKQIAAGERWGILLDGLDELQGEDAQCNIIQLISTFAHEHRDAPLVWMIASRPESHISNTFDDDEVRRSCWSEYIPIDSTEACADVDHFLRSRFTEIQKKYRHSIPRDWPSDTDYLKLTAAASGLFVYAQVVVDFIRDLHHADPMSRFKVLLSVIDRSPGVSITDNPFVYLDTLYHEIISSIPSVLWPAAKQCLGFMIHAQSSYFEIPQKLKTPRGMSLLFSLNLHTIYACLTKCPSTLKIPEWKAAHKEKLTFLHASFADYLQDPARSGDFHVGDPEDITENVFLNILKIWNRCSGEEIATASVKSMWDRYCAELDEKTPSKDVAKYHATFFYGVVVFVGSLAGRAWEKPVGSLVYAELRKVNIVKLCHFFDAFDFAHLLFARGSTVSDDNVEGFYQEAQLRGLKVGHLDLKDMRAAARVHYGRKGIFSKEDYILHQPRSSAELTAFLSELQYLQKHISASRVVIIGGVPNGKVAVFKRPTDNDPIYYVIPYSE